MMNRSINVLMIYTATFIVSGLIGAFLSEEKILAYSELIHGIIIAVLSVTWLHAHASENEVKINRAYIISVILLSPIAIPVYFFHRFGFKTGLIKTSKAFFYLVACCVLYYMPIIMFNYENV